MRTDFLAKLYKKYNQVKNLLKGDNKVHIKHLSSIILIQKVIEWNRQLDVLNQISQNNFSLKLSKRNLSQIKKIHRKIKIF